MSVLIALMVLLLIAMVTFLFQILRTNRSKRSFYIEMGREVSIYSGYKIGTYMKNLCGSLLVLLFSSVLSCNNVQNYGVASINAHYVPQRTRTTLKTTSLPIAAKTIVVTITGTDFTPIIKNVDVTTNPSGTTISGIPAGNDRTVSVEVEDASHNIIAKGKTTGVKINANSINPVDILITDTGVFTQLEDKVLPRAFAISCPLPDGRYIILGGITEQYSLCGNGCVQFKATSQTELYNPGTGKFSQGPQMIEPRSFFTASILDNGNIVVIGGTDTVNVSCSITTCSIVIPPQNVKASIEIYDPVSNSFFKARSLLMPRAGHTTNLIKDNLLVAGGIGVNGPTNSAELIDLKADNDILYQMVISRIFQSGITYPVDRVLLAGGNISSDKIEIFQLSNGFSLYNNIVWQAYFTASLFVPATEEIILNGGIGKDGEPLGTLAIMDSTRGVFAGYRQMESPRAIFSDVLLGDNTILIGGGITTATFTTTTSAEIFSVSSKSFVKKTLLTTLRAGYAAQSLLNGSALLISGFININPLKGSITFADTAEIYNP
ncbi:MAG: kelch repeat-containing protein [bacterium]